MDFKKILENKMLLDEIINQLEPIEQDLITSYYYDELTHSELALRYNISQAQVTSKLKKALDFITKTISKNNNHIYVQRKILLHL